MWENFKLTVGHLTNDPRTRVILVLSTLIIAALAGGAPSDFGH